MGAVFEKLLLDEALYDNLPAETVRQVVNLARSQYKGNLAKALDTLLREAMWGPK